VCAHECCCLETKRSALAILLAGEWGCRCLGGTGPHRGVVINTMHTWLQVLYCTAYKLQECRLPNNSAKEHQATPEHACGQQPGPRADTTSSLHMHVP
jgi:hypothetical protein